MKKLLKWQEKFLVEINEMTNEELVNETLFLAGGDDYDGCFTKQGEWKYAQLLDELWERLRAWDFIGE